jgi:hypothetical protein
MSERLDYDPSELPHMKLTLGEDREFNSTPENTTLFTHLGRLAMYDHIFLQTGSEDNDIILGTYVFNTHSSFEGMADFMMDNHYPMILNKLEAADCDVQAFNRMIEQQAGDLEQGVPDDWV